MRSQLPLALLALATRHENDGVSAGPARDLLRSPVARTALGLAAIGELIVDKLPFVPNRNEPGPLAGRMIFGGVAGAALARETGWSALAGALVGSTAAGFAAVGAYHLRAAAGRATGLPDPLLGGGEDALAIALGLWAVRAA
jgi:uncharacterized membrane protein